MSLAKRFVLGRVGVREFGDVAGEGFPAGDQLCLPDQLVDAGADHVDPDDRPSALRTSSPKPWVFEIRALPLP